MTTKAPASPRASIDVRGRTISTFVAYEALSRLRGMADGDVLEIVAEPFSPIDSDIAAWCRMTGHTLVGTSRQADRHVFQVRKGAATPGHRQTFALVVSEAGLEEILSPLAFARGALARAGHIPPQEKLRQLRELDARFYACAGSMQHFGVSSDEFIFEDITVCEYLTFLEVMRSAETAIMLQ